jgi:hypothetical protein
MQKPRKIGLIVMYLIIFCLNYAATPAPSAGTVAQGQMSAPTSVRRAKRANSASSALPSAARQHIQVLHHKKTLQILHAQWREIENGIPF